MSSGLSSERSAYPAAALFLSVLCTALLLPASAAAHLANFGSWELTREYLGELFPEATEFRAKKDRYTDSEVAQLEKELGFELYPEDRNPTFYIAKRDGEFLGVALFIDPRVKPKVLDGAVVTLEVGIGVGPSGAIEAVRIYDYRGDPRSLGQGSLSQFEGRDLEKTFEMGSDGLTPVAGEEEESALVGRAAREALLLMEKTFSPNRDKEAAPEPTSGCATTSGWPSPLLLLLLAFFLEPKMSHPLILLTNDDGVDSKGLATLRDAVLDLGDVWVVAPDSEKSAISHAITLWDPVRIEKRGDQTFAVTGTPTDCVYIALARLLPRTPDLCVSGINHGANLGDDVIYSGTVAGASEATLSDIPSIAVSLASYRSEEFEEAGIIARRVAQGVLERGLPRGVMLNVNVPRTATRDTPVAVTKLGRRYYGKIVHEKEDPRRKPYYWIGGSELGFDDIPGSDCNAVARDLVSVSPVSMDLTCYRTLRELRDWSALEP